MTCDHPTLAEEGSHRREPGPAPPHHPIRGMRRTRMRCHQIGVRRQRPTRHDFPPSTSAESEAAGKAARREAPRSGHAEWVPAPDRPDPVAVLEEESAARCPSSSRSATAGCSPRRSRSSAAPRRSWPPTSPGARGPASPRSSAATRTCRTSASSPRPTGGLSSTSTTSTRPTRAVGVGRQAARREHRDRRARPRLHARQRRTAVLAAVRRYREAMQRFGAMRNLDIWYARWTSTTSSTRPHEASPSRRPAARPRRRARRTACVRCRGSRRSSTAGCGSSATRR